MFYVNHVVFEDILSDSLEYFVATLDSLQNGSDLIEGIIDLIKRLFKCQ